MKDTYINKPSEDTFQLICNLLHRFFDNSKCTEELCVINSIYKLMLFTFGIILFLDIIMLKILLEKNNPHSFVILYKVAATYNS